MSWLRRLDPSHRLYPKPQHQRISRWETKAPDNTQNVTQVVHLFDDKNDDLDIDLDTDVEGEFAAGSKL